VFRGQKTLNNKLLKFKTDIINSIIKECLTPS